MDDKNIFQIVPGKNNKGEHIFSVVVKRTYRLENGKVAKRCQQDRPLREADEYYDKGDPEWATIKYEAELAPYKNFVDVVIIGKAYAANKQPTPWMRTNVNIANRKKSLIIFGDRTCSFRPDKPPIFSDPIPFTEMELRYEKAYGGKDETSVPDIPFIYPRNDIGTGVVLKNIEESVEGLSLPNIEHQQDLLTPERIIINEPERWPQQPLPHGFGWLQRNWYPRYTYSGLYPPYVDTESHFPEEAMGLVPKNHIALAKQNKLPSFDTRFNNGASLGLTFTSLTGNEAVSLQGLTPKGELNFQLPAEEPTISLDLGTGMKQLEARLDTICIRPDILEMDMIWRGSQVYPGYQWLPKMTKLEARIN